MLNTPYVWHWGDNGAFTDFIRANILLIGVKKVFPLNFITLATQLIGTSTR